MQNKKRNPWVAFLFSIFPPLGQFYNGQFRKALLFYFLQFLIPFSLYIVKVPSSFLGFIISICCSLLFFLYQIVDAILNARKRKEYKLSKLNRWYYYVAIILFMSFTTLPLVKILFLDILGTYQHYSITASAMKPTLLPEDRFIADMHIYKSSLPKRGDLVVYRYVFGSHILYVKRCVAVANDTLSISNDSLYINERKMSEKYTKGKMDSFHEMFRVKNIKIKVPAGKVFLLNENIDYPVSDSRSDGFIPVANIIGKALYIYYSTNCSRIGRALK